MIISLPIKFGIGFTAGLCAALFPRVIAELATANGSDVVSLFSFSYIVLSLIFAAIIGVVIMILEWEVKSSPKDIFMSALAIPGILSGALNTAASVKDLEQVEKEKQRYENILQQDFQIRTLEPAALEPVSDATFPGSRTGRQVSVLISNAYAAESGFRHVADYGIGVRRGAPKYVVVLDEAQSKQEAEAKATALRNKIPVKIFRSANNRYFITTSSVPESKSNALLEAIRLKREKGLNASLMEVK